MPKAFKGEESVEEERAEHQAIKRAGGDVAKAMRHSKKRKVRRGRRR